jgi:hypothetical protein
LPEEVLREYAGAYEWNSGAGLYLQVWTEAGNRLIALDESGKLRTLYPTDRDSFFAGPGVAVATSIESTVDFERDSDGAVTSLKWVTDDAAPRIAQRVETEKHESVYFSNGSVELAGTLIIPASRTRPPAVILVHGSGPQDRASILPFARFLVSRGMAVMGFDKRGVRESTGDWNTATFDDLAGDVVAAFEYLRERDDIDDSQIGLLGWSQAGWVMPLAAVRAPDIVFLISISGPGVPGTETTIDHARNEMTAAGTPGEVVDQLADLMALQYEFARTGEGWEDYLAARQRIGAGRSPDTFPDAQDHPYWGVIRRLYFYDPGPTLRQLRTPTLALFGELDNNIIADKNQAAWESALDSGVNPDFTLKVLPNANHALLDAEIGNNAESESLDGFVPEYFLTVHEWLRERIDSYGSSERAQ